MNNCYICKNNNLFKDCDNEKRLICQDCGVVQNLIIFSNGQYYNSTRNIGYVPKID